ncbi:MAG: hypothetical protein JST89_13190 [Cyanobacteria bacterium SZAS-4]|nr:hypothetical protein [Cyanobacteria bacterium SZAS-4]
MSVSALLTSRKFLTPADIIGSTFREARLSWKSTVIIFFVPAFIASFSYYVESWPTSHPTTSAIELLLISVGLVLLLMSRFVMRSKQFALLMHWAKQSSDISSAIREAQQNKWLVFKVVWPALVLDATLMLGVHYLVRVLRETHNAGLEAFVLLGSAIVLELPYATINLLNLLFMVIYVKEKTSVGTTCKRFFQLMLNNPTYVASFFLLYVFISMLLDLTSLLVFSIPSFCEYIPMIGKDNILVHIVESILMGIANGFLNAANTFACAALYEQMTMRSEASDLIEQISDAQ